MKNETASLQVLVAPPADTMKPMHSQSIVVLLCIAITHAADNANLFRLAFFILNINRACSIISMC